MHRGERGHVRVSLGRELVALAEELRALGKRDERDAGGDLRQSARRCADRPHLLDLAIDLLEAEARRERQ